MSSLPAVVDRETGETTELVAAHDARALTNPAQGVDYVRAFEKAVATAKALGKDRAVVNRYAEQLVRHVRETGRLIAQLPKRGGKRTDRQPGDTDVARFLADTGLERRTAERWQSLATRITDLTFDETIEAIKADDDDTIALSVFYALAKKAARAEKERQRENMREDNRALIAAAPSPLSLTGIFPTIVIDPPWDWGDEGDHDQLGRARPTYGTMSIDELMAWPVGKGAADDAHLYLWITNRSLPKGFALIEQWGFRYVTCLTWAKPSFGMGNYFRGQTEHVLFGVRGSLPLKRKDAGTLFSAPRGPRGHSSKPAEFYDFVESCSPGPYREDFARGSVGRPDWTQTGAEANAA